MNKFLPLILLLAATLLVSPTMINAQTIDSGDNAAKRSFINQVDKKTGLEWNKIQNATITLWNGSEYTVYDRTCPQGQTSVNGTCFVPVPVPQEICGNGIDDDKDGFIDEGCTVTPPPTTDKPVLPKPSNVFRFSSVADIDDNSGLTTQANLIKKYTVDANLLAGDYDYKETGAIYSKLSSLGLKSISVLADGNHDDCADIKTFMSVNACNYIKSYASGKVQVFVIDGNEPFSCSNSQLAWVKAELEKSTAMYKIVVIHEPFVTVKSDHGPNGAFTCYDPVFQANNVDIVLQGHNHNYQYVKIGKVVYSVVGTGTHDSGSAMYDCDSSTFNSVTVKCITGTNGVVFADLDLNTKNIKWWFISNSDNVVEKR